MLSTSLAFVLHHKRTGFKRYALICVLGRVIVRLWMQRKLMTMSSTDAMLNALILYTVKTGAHVHRVAIVSDC